MSVFVFSVLYGRDKGEKGTVDQHSGNHRSMRGFFSLHVDASRVATSGWSESPLTFQPVCRPINRKDGECTAHESGYPARDAQMHLK